MNTNRILKIVVRAIEKQAMTNDDVHEMKQILGDEPFVSKEEAESLIRAERMVGSTSWAWSEFFIETLTAHLVWERRPTGRILPEDAEWLLSLIDQPRSAEAGNMRILLFALVSEAEEVDPRLVARALQENRPTQEPAYITDLLSRAA